MPSLQGFKVRVRIDGTAFRVSKVSWKRERPKFELPDSEGQAGDGTANGADDGMAHILGKGVTTITLEQATLDTDDNPFDDSVIDLSDVDAVHDVDIIPDKDDESLGFNAPRVRFAVAGGDADVASLQPVRLEGIVDGDCTLPS